MYDVICVGTVAIDLYFRGDALPFNENKFNFDIGGKYFATFFHEGLGGGASNVAIGLKKHGINVVLAAKIGDNSFKHVVIQKLNSLQIDHQFSEIVTDFFNISSILISPTGDRSIINYRTQHTDILDNRISVEDIYNTKIVYFANMTSVSIDRRSYLLDSLQKKGIKTVITLGIDDCKKKIDILYPILEKTNILFLNTEECISLLNIKSDEIDSKSNINAKYLIDFNMILVVTDGKNGSYTYTKDSVFFEKATQCQNAIDTTGAGDAYVAGFLSQYIKSKNDIQECMRSGAIYSSVIVGRIGAN